MKCLIVSGLMVGCIITSVHAQMCDFEHHCYPDPSESSTSSPPSIKPPPPLPPSSNVQSDIVHPSSAQDSQILAEYAACMSSAVKSYNQTHSLTQFSRMSGSCQMALRSRVDTEGTDQVSETNQFPMEGPMLQRRRNIGCGYWPAGSDADRACAEGRF
jgi:hypothetical protein